MGRFEANARRAHTNLVTIPQDHRVELTIGASDDLWKRQFERWSDWLDDNLTGAYHIQVGNKGSDKVVFVSFSEVKDATLFKLFFS